MLQQTATQPIKMREFHADSNEYPTLKVYVNGVEMASKITDMVAASEPSVEVDGYAECLMYDTNGQIVWEVYEFGYHDLVKYTLHGRIRWEL